MSVDHEDRRGPAEEHRTSRAAFGWTGLVILLPLWIGLAAPGPAEAQVTADATACALCHQEQADPVPGDPHRVRGGNAGFAAEAGSCASCHQGAAEHVEAGGGTGNILAFRTDAGPAAADACLVCHADSHPRFRASEHASAGVSCAACHLVHQPTYDEGAILDLVDALAAANPTDRRDAPSILCSQCHGDVAAEFQLNERHRLSEGSVGCTACHNPHGPWSGDRLGGFEPRETCVQCHRSVAGPFVFEHDASQVEGCTACHDPHGSVNRHLLSFSQQGELCYSCHVEMPGFHLGSPVRFGPDANCTNCHSAIHGSNFDRYFLR